MALILSQFIFNSQLSNIKYFFLSAFRLFFDRSFCQSSAILSIFFYIISVITRSSYDIFIFLSQNLRYNFQKFLQTYQALMMAHQTNEDDDAIMKLMEKINRKLAKFTDNDPEIPNKVFSNTQTHIFSTSHSLPTLLHSHDNPSIFPHQMLYQYSPIHRNIANYGKVKNGVKQHSGVNRVQFSLEEYKRMANIKESNKKLEQSLSKIEKKIRDLQKSLPKKAITIQKSSSTSILKKVKSADNVNRIKKQSQHTSSNHQEVRKDNQHSKVRVNKSIKNVPEKKQSMRAYHLKKKKSVEKDTEKSSFISQQYLTPILSGKEIGKKYGKGSKKELKKGKKNPEEKNAKIVRKEKNKEEKPTK